MGGERNLGSVVSDRLSINVCFHGIGEPARSLEPGESPYWITTARYEEILDEIASWPSVTISFDDGNASDVELGLSPLVERDMTATFFVLAGRIDLPGSLSTGQLQELRAAGMGIGSHGMDHRPWTGLDPSSRQRELVEARDRIAEVLGESINEAACPLGRYDRAVLRELRLLGYAHVFTSDRLAARPTDWIQPRYSVRCDDTASSLRRDVLDRQSMWHRVRPLVSGWVKRHR